MLRIILSKRVPSGGEKECRHGRFSTRSSDSGVSPRPCANDWHRGAFLEKSVDCYDRDTRSYLRPGSAGGLYGSLADGFGDAHIGWMFKDREADPTVYARHLLSDPIVLFVSRTFFVWVGLSLLIPFLLGGWSGLLWGGLVRICLTHHVTWSVNSVSHTFGRRAFETPDRSRNEWLVGLLAFGEGWHNNHHAFPRSAFHGLHWWQVDLSSYVIWTLERVGLVKEVYRVTPAMRAHRSVARIKTSSGQAQTNVRPLKSIMKHSA